jgi:NCAIR mutase (PurE)-related protein
MRNADVVLVAAGMDGALSSIVAGVVECPVVRNQLKQLLL